jgi:cyclopropane-fatty-acyl-phospholipid synthase
LEAKTKQAISSNRFDRTVANWICAFVGYPRIAIRLWNGTEYYFGDRPRVGTMEFHTRRALVDLLISLRVGFGEGYSKGKIDIHGDMLEIFNEFSWSFARRGDRSYYLGKLHSLLGALRGNSLARSRDNVHSHYDLGNDFYKMWLDEHMVYTCAYYEQPDLTLADAQIAKLDHVCRKLQLKPGQDVIEAGCGWGALAMHMAEHYGVNVTAYNISREQVSYAREQAAARDLGKCVEFVADDYRTISQQCDVFVSVGMLEHVGRKNFRKLGGVINRCLKPGGLGLIHSIGRSHSTPSDPWITKRIFPGGYVPTLGEITSIFEPHKFSILDVENLRLHYARTCKEWLHNFEAVSDKVRYRYNEEFVRAWRLYLAGAATAFQSGTLQLYQIMFAPGGNNDVPWSRDYQYSQHSEED